VILAMLAYLKVTGHDIVDRVPVCCYEDAGAVDITCRKRTASSDGVERHRCRVARTSVDPDRIACVADVRADRGDDGQILPTDLPPQVVRHATAPTVEHTGTLPVGQTLDDYIRDHERHYIDETIKFNAGSREKAAKMLGISMATLYRKLDVKVKKTAGKK
jgi:DNA-binding NtrC family response regulator